MIAFISILNSFSTYSSGLYPNNPENPPSFLKVASKITEKHSIRLSQTLFPLSSR